MSAPDWSEGFADTTTRDLLPHHQQLIIDSGISPEVADARGYRSVTTPDELAGEGFTESQRRLPTLLIPIHTVTGGVAFCQSRPDEPRTIGSKPVKYETPTDAHMVLDVPPASRDDLNDPAVELFITEGVRKADAAVSQGYCCVDLLGVDCWRGTNEKGGVTALADWEHIALNSRTVNLAFDSDVTTKVPVQKALKRLRGFLQSRKATVYVLQLPPGPNGEKVGLDDFLAGQGDLDALVAEAKTAKDFEPSGKLTEPLNDMGDAVRFAALYRTSLAWSPNLKRWFYYESKQLGSGLGGRWVEDVGDIRAMSYVKLMVRGWYQEALGLNAATSSWRTRSSAGPYITRRTSSSPPGTGSPWTSGSSTRTTGSSTAGTACST